ncbi:hypothetical protein [Rhizobium leguminosarum]
MNKQQERLKMVGDEIRHARRDIKTIDEFETQKNIEEKQSFPNSGVSPEIAAAALWLSANFDAIRGNVLLELMARYHISVLDAVDASRRAHRIRYAGQTVPAS